MRGGGWGFLMGGGWVEGGLFVGIGVLVMEDAFCIIISSVNSAVHIMCTARVRVFGIRLRIHRWSCGRIDGDGWLVYHQSLSYSTVPYLISYPSIIPLSLSLFLKIPKPKVPRITLLTLLPPRSTNFRNHKSTNLSSTRIFLFRQARHLRFFGAYIGLPTSGYLDLLRWTWVLARVDWLI